MWTGKLSCVWISYTSWRFFFREDEAARERNQPRAIIRFGIHHLNHSVFLCGSNYSPNVLCFWTKVIQMVYKRKKIPIELELQKDSIWFKSHRYLNAYHSLSTNIYPNSFLLKKRWQISILSSYLVYEQQWIRPPYPSWVMAFTNCTAWTYCYD